MRRSRPRWWSHDYLEDLRERLAERQAALEAKINGGDDDESFAIGAGYGQGPWSVGAGYSYATEDVTNDQFEGWYVAGKYNIAKGLYTSVGATFAESTVGNAVAGAEPGPGGNATEWWQATWTLGMSF